VGIAEHKSRGITLDTKVINVGRLGIWSVIAVVAIGVTALVLANR
jgi:hypothetical protein